MSLTVLLQILERCPDVESVRDEFVQRAIKHFEAKRGAIFLLKEMPEAARGSFDNPIIRHLMEHHAPLHERQIMEEGRWEAICPRSDHGHILIGPIVGNGQITGALGFTRMLGDAPFSTANVSDLTALCLHLSSWFALHKPEEKFETPNLTPREKQVTQLASQGLTNMQIAEKLCVSSDAIKQTLRRVFNKTGLKSRVELARWWTINFGQ